uniref:Uncharacterized protein n=1 Tax=Schistosoma japonicum TaxID=6182 RepID=C1LJZ9_SCHJA|nr:hypothetical protein [Schistosoma japonicum]
MSSSGDDSTSDEEYIPPLKASKLEEDSESEYSDASENSDCGDVLLLGLKETSLSKGTQNINPRFLILHQLRLKKKRHMRTKFGKSFLSLIIIKNPIAWKK